jgi:flagellin-like hook-associated protein FlgL
MSLTVNSNSAATKASFNLSKANDALRKSLARLSSGNRIVDSNDDPGGMSVAYKLNSRLRRTEAVRQNVQNAISFLQVQDGALQSAGNIVSRMSELRAMAQDVTKNNSDVENYSKEFLELQKQLSQIYREKFNGVELFAVSDSEQDLPPDSPILHKGPDTDESGNSVTKFSRRVFTHDGGQAADGNVSIGVINFEDVFKLGALDTRHVEKFTGKFTNLSNAGGLNSKNYSTTVTDSSATSTTASTTSTTTGGDSTDWTSDVYGPMPIAGTRYHGFGTSITDRTRPAIFFNSTPLSDADNWRILARENNLNIDPDGSPQLTEIQNGTIKIFVFDLPGGKFTYDYTLNDLVDIGDGNFSVANITTTEFGNNLATYFGSMGPDSIISPDNGIFGSEVVEGTILDDEIKDLVGDGTGFGGRATDQLSSSFDTTTPVSSESGDASPASAADEASTPEQNAEVFTDDGHLSSVLFVSMGQFTNVIARIADARAENGAEQNRLLMVDELLASNMTNLEAAHGRIMDADIALESSRFARHNVMVQAAASMVAQANQLTNVALTLLGR